MWKIEAANDRTGDVIHQNGAAITTTWISDG
jgi:hypothetical protein